MRAADTKGKPAEAARVWPPPALDAWMIETEQSPEAEWMVNKLLPRDALVLVSGRAKRARKSLFTMLLVRAILEGRPELLGPAWGVRVQSEVAGGAELHPVEVNSPDATKPPRALMVAYEGPAKSTAKLWRWLSGTKPGTKAPEWMSRVRWCHRYSQIKLNDVDWVNRLCAYVREQQFSLVIIDTFRRALTGNERDDENVSGAIDALEKIRNATNGGAVIFVHHIRKPPPKSGAKEASTEEEDFDDEVRGSTAIPGAYDHHLAVRGSFDQKALWLFTRSKIDEDRFFRLDWKIDDGAASCVVTEWATPLTNEQLADLHEAAPMGGKLKDFAKRWNLPLSFAEEAIEQLEIAGMVREDRGRYVKEE